MKSHVSHKWNIQSPLCDNHTLYFVSSQERQWRHSARHRINAAKRIICASIPGFLFERIRKHSMLLCTTRWRHGRSRGETKYRLDWLPPPWNNTPYPFFFFSWVGGGHHYTSYTRSVPAYLILCCKSPITVRMISYHMSLKFANRNRWLFQILCKRNTKISQLQIIDKFHKVLACNIYRISCKIHKSVSSKNRRSL